MKIQPAHTRIEKTESGDRITLTLPAKGPRSPVGLLLGLLGFGLLWLAFSVAVAKPVSADVTWTLTGVVGIAGTAFLVAGIAEARRSWTFERTPEELVYTRIGLLGRSVRRWAAADVSSLWVEEGEEAGTHQPYYALMIGFRNGRNEDVLGGKYDEELRWMATMLSESRGVSRRGPALPEQLPAPVRPRAPATAPDTLTARRFPSGIELTFLPLLEAHHRKRRLLGITALMLLAIIGGSAAFQAGIGAAFPAGIARVAVALVFVILMVRIWVLKRAAVIQIQDESVTIAQNHGRGNHHFNVSQIEFVQTFRNAGRTELQILLREHPKLRLFEGRPAEELEWAARFLRLALRGQSEEESSKLQVDAAMGDCQVCGEKMDRRVVYCAKCRTPHHEECWSYVGQCSTYGCREIRFSRS